MAGQIGDFSATHLFLLEGWDGVGAWLATHRFNNLNCHKGEEQETEDVFWTLYFILNYLYEQ